MGKKTFSKVVLCHTEDFGQKNDKIRKWVEYHGGRVHKSLTPEVTHLVASKKAWKNGYGIVTKAKKLSSVHIVTLDWLEDSLEAKSRKPKPVKRYLWSTLDNARKQRTLDGMIIKMKKVEEKLMQFDRECEQLARDLGQDGYHLYTDPTAFTYSITLARPRLLQNRIDRYHIKVRQHSSSAYPLPVPVYYFTSTQHRPIIILSDHGSFTIASPPRPFVRVPIVRPLAQQIQLIESDTLPHTYGLYVRYSTSNAATAPQKIGTDLLCPLGSSFEIAFAQFRAFFLLKTGIVWERRLDGLRGPEMHGDGRNTYNIDNETGVKNSEWFTYLPPQGREPKGLMLGEITMMMPNAQRNGAGAGAGAGMNGGHHHWVDNDAFGGGDGEGGVEPRVNVVLQARTPEGGW